MLDLISTKRPFKNLEVLFPTITNILYESLASGTVPFDLKTAVWRPFYLFIYFKSLDPDELKKKVLTYFESTISVKTLGRTCYLTTFFASINTPSTQHPSAHLPVRAQHGDCSYRVFNDILTSLDDDTIFFPLLLDFSGAFDTICHEILLSRLQHDFGMVWPFWQKQYVHVDSQKITETSLDFVVPQGSVLGPVLFIRIQHHLQASLEKNVAFVVKSSHVMHNLVTNNYSGLVHSLQDCVKDIGL